MGRLARLGTLGLAIGVSACAAETEDGATSADDLRTDSSAMVPTTDSAVRVLSAYNAFLDRATVTPCVASTAPATAAGDVSGGFYLQHVKTRDDLAKELDVDVDATVKAPETGSVDASTKVVQTFKESTTTVSYLLRAFRAYSVTSTGPMELTPAAAALLKSGSLDEFIHQCGGSFAQTVRYQAQVVAMMRFEAKTEESARSIEASFGGATPAAKTDIAPGGTADIKTKAQQTASANGASLSISIDTSGFFASPPTVDNTGADGFDTINALYKQLSESFDKDLAGDRANYFGNQRNARPSLVAQASYGSLANRPPADYAKIGSILGQAEEFVQGVSPYYLRVQRAYVDEVSRFLGDGSEQYRYNLASAPKLGVQDLVPIAQQWAAKLATDGGRDDAVIKPLRTAIDRCTSSAANGDYKPCATTPDLEKAKQQVSAALAAYAKGGRILPVDVSMPHPGATMSYRNAEPECDGVKMRMAHRDELPLIAPAVSALAPPAAQIWFAGDSTCAKPVYTVASGRTTFDCMDNMTEPLPWVEDQPVLCVGLSGPITARPAP
jgi:hypothetical protein